MKTLLLLLSILFIPTMLSADEIQTMTLRFSKDGTFILTIKDGLPSISRTSVIDLDDIEDTPQEPNPNPPTLSERAQEIREVVQQIDDPQAAENLAGLFIALAQKADNGDFNNRQELESAIQDVMSYILRGREDEWKPFQEKMKEQFSEVVINGGNIPELTELMREIATGLSSDTPSAIDLQNIFELIQLVLKPTKTPQDYLRMAELVLELFRK